MNKTKLVILIVSFIMVSCSPLSARDRGAIGVCNSGISISSETKLALQAVLKEKRISGELVSKEDIMGAFVNEPGLTTEQRDKRAESYHKCLTEYWANNK